MTRQSLEEEFAEFAARIWLDKIFRVLMSENEIIKSVSDLYQGGLLRELGKLSADSIFPVFVTSSVIALPRVKKFLERVKSKNKNLEEVDTALQDPQVFEVFAEAFRASGKLNDDGRRDILADLVTRTINEKDDQSVFSLNVLDCIKTIPFLKSEHLRYLGMYAAIAGVIGNQKRINTPDLRFALAKKLISPLAHELKVIQRRDVEHLMGQSCLLLINGPLVDCYEQAITFDFLVDMGDQEDECSHWINHAHAFLSQGDTRKRSMKMNEASIYKPTLRGLIIGYFVLEYLSNYHDPFYGVED